MFKFITNKGAVQILKKYGALIIISALFVAAVYFIYQKLTPKVLPADLIAATGRIDGDLINLNAKYAGRIKTIFIDDGQPIKKGEIVAILESREYGAKKEQAKSQIKMLQKQLQANIDQLEISQKTVPNAVKKSRIDISITINNKHKLLDKINRIKLKFKQDEKDYLRYKNLFENGAVAKRKAELAKLQLDGDIKSLNALEEELKTADRLITISKINLQDATAQKKTIDMLKNSIAASKEQIKAYCASEKEIEAILSEMVIKSPVNGYVVEKIANPGEVVGAGMPLATLIDPHSLYLKIFVDTMENGKIKLGDKAEIFLDAYPDKPIAGKVVSIAQQAEFTPKEVSVRSDRIQRVYAVHIKSLEVNSLLKLGIPAIGIISLDEKGLPKSLKDIPPL